jgi:hypothetical protein
MIQCLKEILSESLLYFFGYVTKEVVISAHTGFFSPRFGNSAICWSIIPDMKDNMKPWVIFPWLRSPSNYLIVGVFFPRVGNPTDIFSKIVIEPLSLAQELKKSDSAFHIELGTGTKNILKK